MAMKRTVKASWLGEHNPGIRIGFFIPYNGSEGNIGKELVILFHRQGNKYIFIRETSDWQIKHIAEELSIDFTKVLDITASLIKELKQNSKEEIEYDFDEYRSKLWCV